MNILRLSAIILFIFSITIAAPRDIFDREPTFFDDSLNCQLIGSWPFGPIRSSSCDPVRNLVFCSSGGGVYVLDASNISNPIKISEAIHCYGIEKKGFSRRISIDISSLW